MYSEAPAKRPQAAIATNSNDSCRVTRARTSRRLSQKKSRHPVRMTAVGIPHVSCHHPNHNGRTRTEATLIISPNARESATTKDRKSTRLNSSHLVNSYAVFCLKKKNIR